MKNIFILLVLLGLIGYGFSVDISVCTNDTITSTGSYVLTASLNGTLTTGDGTFTRACITVMGSNIDLNCNGFSIVFNSSLNGNGAGIFVNNTATAGSNITIRNCNIYNYTYGVLAIGANSSIIQYNNITNVSNSNGAGIYLHSSNYTNVTSNTINVWGGSTTDGVYSLASHHAIISSNTAQGATSSNRGSFYLEATSHNSTLEGNTAYNSSRCFSILSSETTVSSNTAYNCTSAGIYSNAANFNATSNTVYNNSVGISLASGATFAIISSNTVYGNAAEGIYTLAGATNASLTSNTVHGNTGSGIRLAALTPTLTSNTVYNESIGTKIVGDTVTINTDHYYANTVDILKDNGNAILRLNQVSFDSSSDGSNSPYMLLSLYHTGINSAWMYNITHATTPSTLPSGKNSFLNKYLNISYTGGNSVTFNNLSFHWVDGELGSSNENSFVVQLLNSTDSTWYNLNSLELASLDTNNNYINLSTFKSDGIFGIFYTAPSSDSGSSSSSSKIMTLNYNASCDKTMFTLSDTNGPLSASVYVAEVGGSYLQRMDTDSKGQVTVPLCGKQLRVQISKTGYIDIDTKITPACSCAQVQCKLDSDCASTKMCQNSMCVDKPKPQCTIDSDCTTGQMCQNNACVTKPVTPQCTKDTDCASTKMCQNSMCVDKPKPQCTIDSDCTTGQMCEAGICKVKPAPVIQYTIVLPSTPKAGESATLSFMENGAACANCNVELTDPSGKKITGTTDVNGKYVFTPIAAGSYTVSLWNNGAAVKTQTMDVASSTITPPKPTPTSDNGGLLLVIGIIIIVIIGGVAYWYTSQKK